MRITLMIGLWVLSIRSEGVKFSTSLLVKNYRDEKDIYLI